MPLLHRRAAAAVRAYRGIGVDPTDGRTGLTGSASHRSVATVAAEHLGRLEAHELVEKASHRTLENGTSLREELLYEPRLSEVLTEEEIDAALDPAGYLGSAGEFVDRALKLYREGDIW